MSDKHVGETAMLAAALLWARNHLDLAASGKSNQVALDRVIECLDRVLKHREPTFAQMQAFREFYLREG